MTLAILTMLSLACSQNGQTERVKVTNDTVVGSKLIKDEIAGSSYRNKSIGYFVVINKDTSDFTCILIAFKENGKVGLDLNIPYLKNTVTHKQRFKELKLILTKASKDFNFDSLNYIRFGRLVQSGDLAIEITEEYKQKHKSFKNLFINYNKFEKFLVTSKLGRDIESVFKPYSIAVESVSIEKLFLTTRKDLYWASAVETNSTEVPDKILDCMTVVGLKKKK